MIQTQNISIETYDRHNPSAKHCNSTASPRRPAPRTPTPVPELKPARRSAAAAHNPLSRKAEYRPAAPARNNAPMKSRASDNIGLPPTPSAKKRAYKKTNARHVRLLIYARLLSGKCSSSSGPNGACRAADRARRNAPSRRCRHSRARRDGAQSPPWEARRCPPAQRRAYAP